MLPHFGLYGHYLFFNEIDHSPLTWKYSPHAYIRIRYGEIGVRGVCDNNINNQNKLTPLYILLFNILLTMYLKLSKTSFYLNNIILILRFVKSTVVASVRINIYMVWK